MKGMGVKSASMLRCVARLSAQAVMLVALKLLMPATSGSGTSSVIAVLVMRDFSAPG